jgi:glycosyltransferase involved in cell wall biosynthesis
MPRVMHVVVTDKFAGVERYVATTAREMAARGWDVCVVGGARTAMLNVAGGDVVWAPGATVREAVSSVALLGASDICHVHMTLAELVGVATRPAHRAPIVSTRHFARHRGSTSLARSVAPLLARALTREIAVSNCVADQLERLPAAVIMNGVPLSSYCWRPENRVVLVLQRLEREKDTFTALRAWQHSELARLGWSLKVVGEGSERLALECWVDTERVSGVTFAGWSTDVQEELGGAGMLLAPCPNESVGLSVLEAMAAGVPVVACGSGGHVETAGLLPDALMFAPGDPAGAAMAMRAMTTDAVRQKLSTAGRELVKAQFSVSVHAERLLAQYDEVIDARRRTRTGASMRTKQVPRAEPVRAAFAKAESGRTEDLREIVVCSLEPWDQVWRRNQFFVDILLKRNPELRILFVEPPTDPIFDVLTRRAPSWPRVRTVGYGRRLHALKPLKPLPRRLGTAADATLRLQLRLATRLLKFSRPTLWINDVTYAPLMRATDWPSVYDVTDDWLAAPFPHRELARLERLEQIALNAATAVTVCSRELAKSRAGIRSVTLIPNAVDTEHFRRPHPRPTDLPACPVAVYVGTLHESRLDIDLVIKLARSLPSLNVVLIGPNSLADHSRRKLASVRNVSVKGPRRYEEVPAYLQHADVVVVPHLQNDFTESLDPIKAYECLACETPTVATPVAGFRKLKNEIRIAQPTEFPSAVEEVLRGNYPRSRLPVPTWTDRVSDFERILRGVL